MALPENQVIEILRNGGGVTKRATENIGGPGGGRKIETKADNSNNYSRLPFVIT